MAGAADEPLPPEMTAEQLCPERFGARPAYENGDTYPAFDEHDRLFGHGRAAEIVTDGV